MCRVGSQVSQKLNSQNLYEVLIIQTIGTLTCYVPICVVILIHVCLLLWSTKNIVNLYHPMNLGISHIEFATKKKKRTQSQNRSPRHRKRRSGNTSTNFLQLLQLSIFCTVCRVTKLLILFCPLVKLLLMPRHKLKLINLYNQTMIEY